MTLEVIPKWYYFQNQGDSESNTKIVLLSESGWFWKSYQNGITFRITDAEGNTILVLLSESVISESNTKLVLLSESLILEVIPKLFHFQT